jgi:head-tail adaptor
MTSGRRACYVEIWAPDTSNSTGEPNPPMALRARLWASIIPDRSREEKPQAGERMASVVYKMSADYYDALGIDETMVVRFEGAEFGINGVLTDYVTRGETTFDIRKQARGA